MVAATITTDAVDSVRNHPRKAERPGSWRPGHWDNRRSPASLPEVRSKCRRTPFWCCPMPLARCGCWIPKVFNRLDDGRFGFVYLPLNILDSTSAWGEHPIGLVGIFVHCRGMKKPIFQMGAKAGTWSPRRLKKATQFGRPEFPVVPVRHSFPVIAMAASAGGLKALSIILNGLPADFPAAIAIVMHVAPDHRSLLAEILNCRASASHTGSRGRRARSFPNLCRDSHSTCGTWIRS